MDSILKPISRRKFLALTALGGGALLSITVLPKAYALDGGEILRSTISKNHGHKFEVSLDDIMAAGTKSYNIKGSALHSHKLDITQEILDTLKVKKIVDVDTTNDFGHSHVVRLEIIAAP